jgi:DNA-binding FadR family transcriptional regulator
MVFEPVSQKRVSEIVTEKIESSILDGTFEDGSKLPPEEQLASQLGVGRRAVREALKILEAKGLISIQMGVGAIVQRNDLDSFLKVLTHNVRSYLSINKADLEHVMKLRQIFEGAAVDELVNNPDPQKILELTEIVEKQRHAFAAGDYAAYQEWHFEFHNSIVNVLDNPVISMIYQQMLMLIRASMEKTGSQPEVTHRAIEDHQRMVDALSSGSLSEYRDIQRIHLLNSIKDITTYGI